MIHSQVPSCGDGPGTKRWNREAKETKRGEMDGREAKYPTVAMKRGNAPCPEAAEATGVTRGGPDVENTPKALNLPECQRKPMERERERTKT